MKTMERNWKNVISGEKHKEKWDIAREDSSSAPVIRAMQLKTDVISSCYMTQADCWSCTKILNGNLLRNAWENNNSTELGLSREAASCAVTQEFPSILMEKEGSLQCSQEPCSNTYPKPDQSSPLHPILSLQDLS
jgi:hypothetical protein